MTRRRREPLPAGGHTPQHITPNPQAVRIPRGPAPGAPHNKKRRTTSERPSPCGRSRQQDRQRILPYLMDHTERDDLATEINRRTQA